MDVLSKLPELTDKSTILHPGIDFSKVDAKKRRKRENIPTLLWNHRWEYDKDPETFFSSLYEIKKCGVEFRLIILGEAFRTVPECFEEAGRRLSNEIIHMGYVEAAEDYYQWLKQCDIVVSTALHEFYGVAVIEALRAGCRPLLPARLSYPELFPAEYLYKKGDLTKVLLELLENNCEGLAPVESLLLTQQFSWENTIDSYKQWLCLE